MVELKKLFKKVDSFISTSLVNLPYVLPFNFAEGIEVFLGFLVSHETDVIFIWSTKHLKNNS